MNNAKLIIFSGPSGSGKGTIIAEAKKRIAFDYSISATTRVPREGELDGVDYHFLSKDEFENRISTGDLLEFAEYCGNFYGTLKSEVEKSLSAGRDVLLEIEVQGAMLVKKKMPDSLMIFVLPPSLEILESRLRRRNTESDEAVARRIKQASFEMSFADKYDYTIINDDLDVAVDKFIDIIQKEKKPNAERSAPL